MKAASIDRLLSTADKILVFAESFARRRGPAATRSPRLIGAAVVVLSLILISPVFVPLGNPLTAAPLALLGLALLEEDGLLCALGLAGTVLTLVYHAAFARLIWSVLKRGAAAASAGPGRLFAF